MRGDDKLRFGELVVEAASESLPSNIPLREDGPLLRGERLPRLDSLFRVSPDVARRLGLIFGELPIRGETRVAEVEHFYDIAFGPHEPDLTLAEWAGNRGQSA